MTVQTDRVRAVNELTDIFMDVTRKCYTSGCHCKLSYTTEIQLYLQIRNARDNTDEFRVVFVGLEDSVIGSMLLITPSTAPPKSHSQSARAA
jgi:hypothetical protein